ncbi:glycosyltransferase family 2 protein [Marinimicrobium sp. C6131]|uniref:glycosyltransferase family 2 protein n=1 Tax=Marinimicrobium sp. C6131 TaxID=3022676 RepID=UPI00223DA172|nr:glycosyltransferase family A protein [Marinimicrobium sp. C6131]UZJ45342.1 glycosyltransferase family 2 protein [Marinimicrobium sp. C6131]
MNIIGRIKTLVRFWLDVRMVYSSPLFDETFYGKQNNPGGAVSRLQSVVEFLTDREAYEISPSQGFSSDWYLHRYPDVEQLGVNPLVHYLRFGKAEGRLPFHGATPGEPVPEGESWVSRQHSLLWGGFEHLAMPALIRCIKKKRDMDAMLTVAEWHYAYGDLHKASNLLEGCLSNAKPPHLKRCLVGLSKCYSLLAERESLGELLSKEENRLALSDDLPFVESNSVVGRAEGRLEPINRLYRAHGLAPVAPQESSRPLSLKNLTGLVDAEGDFECADPLVSVVVPAFNAEEGIGTALDSLLSQTWRNLEVIVVDDCSSDATCRVVEAYAATDARVRLLRNERNRGAYPSRNRGMQSASGQFVTVHDSDDWSHPQKLERQMQPLLQNDRLIATVSSWARVTPDMRFVGSWMLTQGFIEDNFSSWLIRRDILERIGLWDAVNVAADTEFLWRMEHHYGYQSLYHVCKGAPLSFALSDASTLTQTKATHVKTVYYGLRRLYREASSWWHRQSGFAPVMEEVRPFPAPIGNLKDASRYFDVVVIGDFAEVGTDFSPIFSQLDTLLSDGQALCLVHWPDPEGWLGRPVRDDVFDFCQSRHLTLGHSGVTVEASTLMLLDGSLWRRRPTRTIAIEKLDTVIIVNGLQPDDADAIKDYFAHGGYDYS